MLDKARILVVQWQANQLRLFNDKLVPFNYQVIFASNGSEALGCIKYNPPHLIFIDAETQAANAFELTKQLKSAESTRFIPIIIMIPRDRFEDRSLALENGAPVPLSFHLHIQQHQIFLPFPILLLIDQLLGFAIRKTQDDFFSLFKSVYTIL